MLDAFLDGYRAELRGTLDGLTEEQARRSLVPSLTTLLGLVKHAAFGRARLVRRGDHVPAARRFRVRQQR